MSFISKALQLSERIGRLTRFVDPKQIESFFSHNSELLKRNVGQNKTRVVRNTFVQELAYNFKGPCDTGNCGVLISDTAKVVLSGATPEKTQLAWEALKNNVDAAIAAGVLDGIPVNMGSTDFLVYTGKE